MQVLAELNTGAGMDFRIASGGGRMNITMDRYNANWPMVERGYRTHVFGEARHFMSTRTAIETLREENEDIGDQDLPAFAIVDERDHYVGPIRDGAAVIFFNFRGDRAIEISRTFEDETFTAFDRSPRPNVLFAGMMQYDGDLRIPRRFLVEPPTIDHTFGEILAANDITQIACSETQKYGHVTYFWNGNRSGKFSDKLETYIEIPSDILPFEERPWMKAAEITDAVINELRKNRQRFGRLNFANGDMVGHTGVRDATVQAVEAVDLQIGRLMHTIRELHGALIVTADHGNADEMFERDASGSWVRDENASFIAKTSHTLNAVPLHLFAPGRELDPGLVFRDAEPGTRTLATVAATAIELLGYEPPADYAPSLLRR